MLERDAENPEALHGLSQLYLEQDDFEQTARLARQIIAQEAGGLRACKAYSTLGYARARQGKMAAAEQAFLQALGIDSTYAKAHYGLANVRITQGRLQEAEAAYRAALSRDPHFSDARYGLGMAHIQRQAWREATNQLQTLLQMDPAYTRAYFALGKARENRGDTAEALSAYRTFVARWDEEARLAFSARERIKALVAKGEF